ncbi:MAG: hypothetical protein ACR2G4_05190 [Pyrinomonadaceae bacterium]
MNSRMNHSAKSSRLVSLALLLLLLLLLCGLVPAWAQNGARQISQLVLPLHDEGFIAFKIEAAPVEAPRASLNLDEIQSALTPQVLLADGHVVHRLLINAAGNFVFGYDLVVEPVAATKQFKVSVKPLSAEFERQLIARQPAAADGATSNVSTLSRAADAQVIEDGDAFALDLLVNAQTGVKIVDIVKVSFDRAKLWSAPRGLPLSDFTLGNVELAVRDYKLTLNGELVGGGGKPARGCAGALVWFYVPERGRFIFSLFPREGYDFQKVGVIESNKISFTAASGDVYEWTSSAPIVGNSGSNWNLWVLHDADYVSDFASPEQIVEGVEAKSGAGAQGSAADWLRNPLARLQRDRRVDYETGNANKTKRTTGRTRVLVGGADRIENLLPKR